MKIHQTQSTSAAAVQIHEHSASSSWFLLCVSSVDWDYGLALSVSVSGVNYFLQCSMKTCVCQSSEVRNLACPSPLSVCYPMKDKYNWHRSLGRG